MKKLKEEKALLIILGIIFSIFLSNLDGQWILDDYSHIKDNPHIKSLSEIPTIFTSTVWETTSSENVHSHIYRPVIFLSWLVNYSIFGINPFYFHLINNLIHILNVLLLFLLARMFFPKNFALLAAVLFGVHPLVVEAVSWMAARQDLLVATFALSNILSLLKWQNGENTKWPVKLIYFATIPLGLFSKETFLLIPFMTLLILFWSKKQDGGKKGILWIFLITLLLTAACWMWRGVIVGVSDFSYLFKNMYLNIKPLIERFSYLFLSPSDSDFVNTYAVKEVNPYIFSLFYITVIAAFVSLYFVLKKKNVYQFGLSLFLLPLIPVSFVMHITGFISERYFYLPFAGFSILFITACFKVDATLMKHNMYKMRKFIIYTGIVWLTVLSIVTISRNRDWNSEKTIYSDSISRNPNNFMAYYFAACHYSRIKDYKKEVENLLRVLEINPNYLSALNNLSVRMIQFRKWDRAKYFLTRAYKIRPKRPKTSYNMGAYFEARGNYKKALEWYQRAHDLHGSYGKAKEAIERVKRHLKNRKIN